MNPRLIILASIAIAGCMPSKEQAAGASVSPWIEAQISELTEKLSKQAASISSLEQRLAMMDFKDSASVSLDMTEKGFQKLSTSVLPLFLKPGDATPYLDGYKIKLYVGNPYAIDFGGGKLTVKWSAPCSTNMTVEQLLNTANGNTKEQDVLVPLKAQYWTPVEVILTPATDHDLHALRVEFDFGTVRFALPPHEG